VGDDVAVELLEGLAVAGADGCDARLGVEDDDLGLDLVALEVAAIRQARS
jgi:hypothetical protein